MRLSSKILNVGYQKILQQEDAKISVLQRPMALETVSIFSLDC